MNSSAESSVILQDVYKSYGFGKSRVEVLKGINLNVSKGTIYGLLGPSGCGKTSLLRCVVGRLRPDKGIISVFGKLPGSSRCEIPGPGVGYMPQELSLYVEFSIEEVLTYVGRLHRMNKADIKFRINFLLDFLKLPNKNKLIRHLSGGQQRRISFAVALLQEPPLVILDEPTVGVDPILRESIWKYLTEICVNGNVTVIITTHYIEEARNATRVGLMRNGKLLAEDQPANLLHYYDLPRLEDVYLKLCRLDDITPRSNKEPDVFTIQINSDSLNRRLAYPKNDLPKPVIGDYIHFSIPNIFRIVALMYKNLTRLQRQLILLIFVIINPAIVMTAFCLAVGGIPKNVRVAIVNQDSDYGPGYLQYLDNDTVHQVPTESLVSGIDLVKYGKVLGVIDIWQNFTPALQERFHFVGEALPEDVLDKGRIHLSFDRADPYTALYLEQFFFDAMKSFANDHLRTEESFELSATLIQMDEPIYGTQNIHMTEFMVPGMMTVVIFIIASGYIALAVIRDRKSGNLDRNYVLGVTPVEVMCASIATNMFVAAIQTIICLALVTQVFNVQCIGNVILVFLLIFLQGLCGISYGWLMSILADTEGSGLMLTVGTLFPFILLSGTLWPLTAANKFVQSISYFIPQTHAIEALRWMMFRGSNITSKPVWLGFASTTAWTLIFLVLCAVIMRLRR